MRPAVVRTLLASALLSLTATALSVPATTAQAAPQAAAKAPAGPTVPLKIGTYNIRSAVSYQTFVDAVSAFKPRVDVAGLQEIGANNKNKFLKRDHHWGYYRPPALQQNPVIWRRDLFDFVSAQGVKIADGRSVGHEHGGGEEVRHDSWATVVRLVQRSSGQQISVINLHLIRGAVKNGRRIPGRPKLFRLYTDQMAGAVRAVKAERARANASDQIYVLGDLNCGYTADLRRGHPKLPIKRFGSLGLTSMWKYSPYLTKPYGTHYDALIDQVYTTARPVRTEIIRSIKQSDHRPAVSTYALADDGREPVNGTMGFQNLQASSREGWDPDHKQPRTMSFEVSGDLRHGYADVKVVAGGSATEGQDFVVDDFGLRDDDLEHNAVLVQILNDHKKEGEETFTLRLVDPVNTTIQDRAAEAVGTIPAN